MKIVVVGGSGLIGTKLVTNFREKGHEVVAASPSLGVDTLTGEGLAEALNGASVVVDVSSTRSFDEKAVSEFFETSTRNLLAAEEAAGVGHHVVLSVVGTEKLLQSPYFRAKLAQENLIKGSKIPYTIVRATQFFEFAGSIAYAVTEGNVVRLPDTSVQPIAADDVAGALVDYTLGTPLHGIVDIAGPERMRMGEFIGRFLTAAKDNRQVVVDANALYFNAAKVDDLTLVPSDNNAHFTTTTFEDWLSRSLA